MAQLKTTVTTFPVCDFTTAGISVSLVDVNVAQMLDCSHNFLKYLPQISVLGVCVCGEGARGALSSSSYCLVPMSSETGSWPDHRFNNSLWYTRSFRPLTRTATWYSKTEPQSLTLGAWVPFSVDCPLDLDGVCFIKCVKSTLCSHVSQHCKSKWQMLVAYFFADSQVDHITLVNEAHIFGTWPSYVTKGK